ALPVAQPPDHPGLLRVRPAPPGRLIGKCRRGLLARSKSKADALVAGRVGPSLGSAGLPGLRPRSALVDLDRVETALGDAQRQRPVLLVPPPDRKRAVGGHLFDQAFGQELAEDLVIGTAPQGRTKLDAAVLALRGRGSQHELGVGEFHRDPPFGLRRRLAPSPPKPRTGDSAGGAGIPRSMA